MAAPATSEAIPPADLTLHHYFRSTASYRVRIALELKGLPYNSTTYDLRHNAQHEPGYLARNPQGFVPALELADGRVLGQSLAICEYLDELVPDPPLLPRDRWRRAQVRAFAQVIACDIHPIQNLKILRRLKALGHDQLAIDDWAARIIEEGFAACAALIAGEGGPYCFGDSVTLADLCLIPQLTNARRFGVAAIPPRLLEIEAACLELAAFRRAAPEAQPGAD